MMMGFGFWLMFLVMSVPVLLLLGLILLAIRPLLPGVGLSIDASPAKPAPQGVRATCRHCGKDLLAEWAHCPHCGAPSDT